MRSISILMDFAESSTPRSRLADSIRFAAGWASSSIDAFNSLAIAAKSPLAVKLGKHEIRDQAGVGLTAAYACASRVMVENMLAAEAEEGISAFFDKRPPQWLP